MKASTKRSRSLFPNPRLNWFTLVPGSRPRSCHRRSGPDPARALTTEQVTDYRLLRREAGAAPATINRELACLKRLLRAELARTPRRIDYMPAQIVIPQEKNARTGFLEPELYRRMATAAVPELWLSGMFEVLTASDGGAGSYRACVYATPTLLPIPFASTPT